MAETTDRNEPMSRAQREVISAIQNIPKNVDITTYMVELAEKAKEDIFSGSPDNAKRAHQLYHQALSGIGHTNSSYDNSDFGDSSDSGQRKKKKRDQAFENFLNTINISIAARESVSNYFAGTRSEIKEVKNLFEKNKKLGQDLEDTINNSDYDDKIKTRALELKDSYAREENQIMENLNAAEETLKNVEKALLTSLSALPETMQKGATELLNAAKDTILINVKIDDVEQDFHILYKNEAGQYCISHPETGEEIALEDQKKALFTHLSSAEGQKLGNEHPPAKNAKLQSMLSQVLKKTDDPATDNYADNMRKSFTTTANLKVEIYEAKTKLEYLYDQKKQLISEFDNKTITPEALATYEEKLANLDAEIDNTIKKIGNKITTAKGELSKNLNTLEADLNSLQASVLQAREDELIAIKEAKLYTESQKLYGGRHEQLKSVHGNFFINNMPVFNGEKTASALGWLSDQIPVLQKMDVVEAWNDSIKHEGKDVYRDNNTGQLYTFGEEAGRQDIQDINVVRALYAEAYGEKARLFKNETPYSADPSNTFQMTRNAILSSEKMANQMEENIQDPYTDKIATLTTEIETIKNKMNSDYMTGVNIKSAKQGLNCIDTGFSCLMPLDHFFEAGRQTPSLSSGTFSNASSPLIPSSQAVSNNGPDYSQNTMDNWREQTPPTKI
ncbi:MAG: hypothetical protein KTR28_01115 [Micavibrio sp.]|nr:hypothetical protein [Micavibrio sp.]